MSVQTNITQRYNNGYVQVEVKLNKDNTHYFNVPEKNARKFCKECKENDIKTRTMEIGSMAGLILLGTTTAALLTRKVGGTMQTMSGVAGGVLGMMLADQYAKSYSNSKYDEMLRKYHAQPVDTDYIA